MSIRSQLRALEKNFIRPIFRKFKSTLGSRKEPDVDPRPGNPRIEELERRMDELEKLVREDLGLRYLELSREDQPKNGSI